MAAPRRSGGTAAATLETCLAEVRAGRPRPVYLFDGDAFLALRAARELAFAVVPEAQRSLNLVELDPATSPGEVAAELSTGGLFGGGKVVLVHEPAFLASKEDAEASFEAARKAWGEGRQRDAARRLLALVAKGGWAAADLDPADRSEGADERLAREFEKEFGFAPDVAFLRSAGRYAVEREMSAARDDSSALDAAIERGFAPGRLLVIAAGKVDGRLPLVKRLAAAGRRVSLGVVNEAKPWEAPRLALGPVLDSLLAGSGKRLDRAGEARLAELVGADARALASEVAKLVAYVGDRKVIGARDVDEVVSRVAEDPFFALGNAVEARDLATALAVLGRSIEDGASPFMLLGSLAGTVRRMIVERERARKAAGGRPIASAREWEEIVLPTIPADEIGNRKPWGFWMKYQASMRFSREELLDALAGLAEADVAMKTGQDGRVCLERVLVGLLGPRSAQRSPP